MKSVVIIFVLVCCVLFVKSSIDFKICAGGHLQEPCSVYAIIGYDTCKNIFRMIGGSVYTTDCIVLYQDRDCSGNSVHFGPGPTYDFIGWGSSVGLCI